MNRYFLISLLTLCLSTLTTIARGQDGPAPHSSHSATPAAAPADPLDLPLPVDPTPMPAEPQAAKAVTSKAQAAKPQVAPTTIKTAAAAPSGTTDANDIPLPLDPTPVAAQPGRLHSTVPSGDAMAAGAMQHMDTDSSGNPGDQAGAQDDALVQQFMVNALTAGATVALLCSYLGLFVVARRMVFIGVALAEMSSAGIALGILAGFAPLWGAVGFMILAVWLFSRRWAPRRIPNDAVIGVFYAVAIAMGILLIAKSARGEAHMLTLLQGNILAVYPSETTQMMVVFATLGLLHLVCAKEFMLVSLDIDTAATQGFTAARWDFVLFLTIGVAVSLAIRSVGVLLTADMLIVPAATAFLVASRWRTAAFLAPLLGVVAVAVGLYLSLKWDFPASAVVVAVSFCFLLPALVWRSLRHN